MSKNKVFSTLLLIPAASFLILATIEFVANNRNDVQVLYLSIIFLFAGILCVFLSWFTKTKT